MARPTQYNQALIETLLNRLINGESLRSICQYSDMPNKSTVFRWLANNQTFCDQYRLARVLQMDLLASEMLDIVDKVALSHSAIQRAKLQVKARQWYASKLTPHVYR